MMFGWFSLSHSVASWLAITLRASSLAGGKLGGRYMSFMATYNPSQIAMDIGSGMMNAQHTDTAMDELHYKSVTTTDTVSCAQTKNSR